MIILYNPHVDDFLAEPPHFKLLRRRPLKKYGFFIEQSLQAGHKVGVLVDGTVSAFISARFFQKIPAWLRGCVSTLEFWRWRSINRFNGQVYRIKPTLSQSNDVVLAFSYKAATGDFASRREMLSRYRVVIFHLSHYFIATAEKSQNLSSLSNVYLAGDSDISDNVYFKKFFAWYSKPILVLPFAITSRFSCGSPFVTRKNHCVATGSFHDLNQEYPREKYNDYISATGLDTYHPIRKALYYSRDALKGKIDCKISSYRPYGSSSAISRIRRQFAVSQKKYFAIDMVVLYNCYKFAVVGEEFSGFPALGAFEAMACGTLLLANEACYKGLGLVPNQHYITYDGSLQGLFNCLEQLQKSKDQNLAEIADKGMNYVIDHFTADVVYKRWSACLMNI